MLDRSFLRWPFFEERHRALADRLEIWAAQHCAHVDHRDVDAACRELVRNLGRDGWLKHTAPAEGPSDKIDVRTLALVRETLARHSGLADFAFAMQGLGAGPISLKKPAGCRRPAAVRRSRRLRFQSRRLAPTSPTFQ
jgi:acyl-CoA dehydrogenase